MATHAEIGQTYDYMSELCQLSLGDYPDITCAMYNGDFSKTLKEAQADKHAYILEHLGFSAGERVLDIGCGWGPVVNAVNRAGGTGVGITLSAAQAQYCQPHGLDVHLLDWRAPAFEELGTFDGLASVGAFEHFCSIKEWQRGEQDQVYQSFFRRAWSVLRPERRFYLQTMLWGERPPKYDEFSLGAKKGSDPYILAVLEKFYPGSWLPYGTGQIERACRPYFKVVSYNNGRSDYIETLRQFGKRNFHLTPRKLFAALMLAGQYLRDRALRYKIECLRRGYNRECFVRGIMDHERIVLQRNDNPDEETDGVNPLHQERAASHSSDRAR